MNVRAQQNHFPRPPRECYETGNTQRHPSSYPMSDATETLPDTPPDRLSTTPGSPYYNEALLTRGVGIRFKGVEKTNVEEYCVSEGWIRVAVGKTMDRKGNPFTIKLNGLVEPYFRDAPPPE